MSKYLISFALLSCCFSLAWSSSRHHSYRRHGSQKCDRQYSDFSIQSISSRNLSYGYAPFWEKKTQSLYFVDFNSVDEPFFRFDYRKNVLYAASLDNGWTYPSFLIPFKGGNNQFLTSIQRTLVLLEWDGVSSKCRYIRNVSAVETDSIYDGNRFDTGKTDPKGHLYVGTYRTDNCVPSSNAYGSLYLFEKNGNIETLITNTTSATGLAFNEKDNLCYFIDLCKNELWEFDWNPSTGQIRNRRTVFKFPAYLNLNYYVNGLDIDRDGNLYVGLFKAGIVLKINPRCGIVERTIQIPVETPTAVGWGGPRLDILFVLTSSVLWDFSTPEVTSYPPAPSELRGQVLMIKGLGARGANAGRCLKNYFN